MNHNWSKYSAHSRSALISVLHLSDLLFICQDIFVRFVLHAINITCMLWMSYMHMSIIFLSKWWSGFEIIQAYFRYLFIYLLGQISEIYFNIAWPYIACMLFVFHIQDYFVSLRLCALYCSKPFELARWITDTLGHLILCLKRKFSMTD